MFADLATSIHADNVTAGWFTDIATGESIVATRNRPEMMMLAVSELSEAAEANGPDDKLTHLPGFAVELADFQIRILDLIGCEVSCGAQMPGFTSKPDHFLDLMDLSATEEGQLMYVVNRVSEAMEHYRKSRTLDYVSALANALLASVALCDLHNIDWQDMIRQKRAFNASRADHKLENRRADGGKRI